MTHPFCYQDPQPLIHYSLQEGMFLNTVNETFRHIAFYNNIDDAYAAAEEHIATRPHQEVRIIRQTAQHDIMSYYPPNKNIPVKHINNTVTE